MLSVFGIAMVVVLVIAMIIVLFKATE